MNKSEYNSWVGISNLLITKVNISPINSKRTPIPYYIDVLHTKLSFNNGIAQ